MATCVRCGAPVVVDARWCDTCLPIDADGDRAPLKGRQPLEVPVPADGVTLRVDDFADGLVPFVGDPKRSRAIGLLVEVVCGLGAVILAVRAAPSLHVAYLAGQVPDLTRDDVRQMASSWRAADEMQLPALAVVLLVGLLVLVFEGVRRPRRVVREQGEAFVEAAAVRISSRSQRRAIVGLFVAGVAGALVPLGRVVELDSFLATAWIFVGVAIGSFALAAALVLVGRLVPAGRRHLDRRRAISAGLDAADVPFVAPDSGVRGV